MDSDAEQRGGDYGHGNKDHDQDHDHANHAGSAIPHPHRRGGGVKRVNPDFILVCARCRSRVDMCRCGAIVRINATTCIRCGNSGHLESNCYHVRSTCNSCGQVGHISPVCPLRSAAPPHLKRPFQPRTSASWSSGERGGRVDGGGEGGSGSGSRAHEHGDVGADEDDDGAHTLKKSRVWHAGRYGTP